MPVNVSRVQTCCKSEGKSGPKGHLLSRAALLVKFLKRTTCFLTCGSSVLERVFAFGCAILLGFVVAACGVPGGSEHGSSSLNQNQNPNNETTPALQTNELSTRPAFGNFGTMPPPSGPQLEAEAKIVAAFANTLDNQTMGLLDSPLTAQYTVVNCASGYMPFGTFTTSVTRALYRGDENCAVRIDSLTFQSKTYTLKTGTFNTADDVTNIFVSAQSSIVIALTTTAQLSTPLQAAGEVASFKAEAIDTGLSHGLTDFLIVTPTAASPTVMENAGSTQFNLAIQGSSASPVTVYYSVGGTALGVLDYTTLSGSVVVPPGATNVAITVTLTNDSIPELSETISITLQKNQPGYFPVETSPSITITDDDAAYPSSNVAARYQPTGFVGTSSINQWTDSTTNVLHATQGTASLQPARASAALNAFDGSSFDGVDDMLLPTNQSSTLLTNATFTAKTISVVMRTGSSITGKQLIYRQGNTTRGLVLYLDGGFMYFAGYNSANDDSGATTPWGVRSVRAPVSANTVYVVRAVMDQPSNQMRIYMNTELVETATGVGRLFSSSGISFGRTTANMRFHDSTTGNGTAFGGQIYELAHLNSATTGNEGLGMDVFLFQKYGLDVPLTLTISSAANGIAEQGGSTTITVTRSRIGVSDLTVPLTISGSATSGVDYVALPTSVVIPAYQSSVSFTLTAIDDAISDSGESVNVQLAASANYVVGTPSLVSIGIADNESFNPPSSQKIWWRASAGVTKDASDIVSQMANQIDANHLLSQTTTSARAKWFASVMNGQPAIKFDGTDDGYTVPNHNDIQLLGPYTTLGYAVAFRTDSNVTTRQLIWEQGNYTSGINIYVESGQLKFGAWNTNTGQVFGPLELRVNVSASTNYFAILQFNANTGQLTGRLNGVTLGAMTGSGSVGYIPTNSSTGSCAGIGKVNSRTSFFGTNTTAANPFRGHLAEFLYFSDVLTTSQILEMESFFFSRYGI